MNFDYLFPDNREKGETPLRQCQLVMLRMLKIFDYLCAKHQIKYFLTGGSLIGAVRHQGFIPWDDDLDVGMTRGNYEKFIQRAVPELPYDIFFYDRSFLPHNFFVITQNILLKWLNNYKKRATILKWIAKFSLFRLVYASSYLQNYGLLKGGTYIKEKEYSNLIKVKFEDMEAWIPKEFDP